MFKIGEKVKLNQRYFDEGKQFGRELEYPQNQNQIFEVKKIVEIKNEECDPFLVYVENENKNYKKITYIASCFLQKVF
jgi:hypothetical protein